MSECFRVYISPDMIGIELGGSLKNVIALAAGMLDGMELGDNTKAALMTRGILEISRLGVELGGKMETFFGLSGIGDLIVTCTSKHSRNHNCGYLLGKGKTLEEAKAEIKQGCGRCELCAGGDGAGKPLSCIDADRRTDQCSFV